VWAAILAAKNLKRVARKPKDHPNWSSIELGLIEARNILDGRTDAESIEFLRQIKGFIH
jgi:hypothetical protein